jgi:hypothetical protein
VGDNKWHHFGVPDLILPGSNWILATCAIV